MTYNAEQQSFVQPFMKENPHLAATFGPDYAFGGQLGEGMRPELDAARRFRGTPRSGLGFRADGTRVLHGQQPLQEPGPDYGQRPGKSWWD